MITTGQTKMFVGLVLEKESADIHFPELPFGVTVEVVHVGEAKMSAVLMLGGPIQVDKPMESISKLAYSVCATIEALSVTALHQNLIAQAKAKVSNPVPKPSASSFIRARKKGNLGS